MSPALPAHLTHSRTAHSLNLLKLAILVQKAFRPGQPHPASESVAPVQPPSDHPVTDPATAARELSQRLVAVQEAVRRDMADYLHDHVQSKLLALSLYLAHCQDLLAQDPPALARCCPASRWSCKSCRTRMSDK